MKHISTTLIITISALFSGLVGIRADDISIYRYITDPGFETHHKVNQQINTAGTDEVNGWRATPLNGNIWTSVSYVEAGEKTLGDKRDAIVPAEGKSYLRMLTQNSYDWLALLSPEFPLQNGATYLISFKIAADLQTPMSKLEVFLRDNKGAYYGLKSYDLLRLEPGWNTIVYKCVYEGPDQQGFLQLRGLRESTGKVGSLNFDDFKSPTKEEANQPSKLEISR